MCIVANMLMTKFVNVMQPNCFENYSNFHLKMKKRSIIVDTDNCDVVKVEKSFHFSIHYLPRSFCTRH